jgi:Transposase, Mutator family
VGRAATGESSKFWLTVLSELKSRGVADVCIVCCDGLTGLPDAISVVWPQATVQLCVVHLIRASLRYASKRDWGPLTKDLRLIYIVVDESTAEAGLDGFEQRWGQRYPAIVKLWRTHWAEFIPFLAFRACRRMARVVRPGLVLGFGIMERGQVLPSGTAGSADVAAGGYAALAGERSPGLVRARYCRRLGHRRV